MIKLQIKIGLFFRDRKGVAAVEAAMIFPILLTMLLGAIELNTALDSRRAIYNASYSLVQSVASTGMVDSTTRDRLTRGYLAAATGTNSESLRAAVYSLVRRNDGSYDLDWTWKLTSQLPSVTQADLEASFKASINPNEGILVSVVEGGFDSVLAADLTKGIRFKAIFSQVPLRKTMALNR